jgi:hypothetical protein
MVRDLAGGVLVYVRAELVYHFAVLCSAACSHNGVAIQSKLSDMETFGSRYSADLLDVVVFSANVHDEDFDPAGQWWNGGLL